jgi:hypothetical protein
MAPGQLRIETVKVDLRSQEVTINHGQVRLRARRGHAKCVLLAYIAAFATKHRSKDKDMVGFTWEWLKKQDQKTGGALLSGWGFVDERYFAQIWTQRCRKPGYWLLDGTWVAEANDKNKANLLESLFLAVQLSQEERRRLDAPKGTRRILLPEQAAIELVPDGADLVALLRSMPGPVPEKARSTAPEARPGAVSRHVINFDAFIDERIKDYFPGSRQFIRDAWDVFLAKSSSASGYFMVLGEPGLGKTAFLAKLVHDRKYDLHHFNIGAQPINTARQFVANIFGRLQRAYPLQEADLPAEEGAEAEFLNRILEEASRQLDGKKLVIVIDALDEVQMNPRFKTANVLFLPPTLPKGIYVIATSRSLKNLTLNVPDTIEEHTIEGLGDENLADVRAYLESRLKREKLAAWVRKHGRSAKSFVNEMLDKSGGNFMYLRHVLPEIEEGDYADLEIDALPKGLQKYYEDHWQRMGMTATDPPEQKLLTVYALSAMPCPVSCRLLAKLSGVSAVTTQGILDKWHQFLHEEVVPMPKGSRPSRRTVRDVPDKRYSFYHASFKDFLYRKDIVQAAGIDLPAISRRISDALKRALHQA